MMPIDAFPFKGKRVLVTGTSGFIGRALAKPLIEAGAEVYLFDSAIDHSAIIGGVDGFPLELQAARSILGDLRDQGQVEHAIAISRPEFVFHLAAITQVTEALQVPVYTFEVNTLGTIRLLEACRRIVPASGKIVIATTDKVYGGGTGRTEEDPLLAVHPYDVSKAAADMAARSYAKEYGMNVQIARMANVYGPGDKNWKRLLPGLISAAICRFAQFHVRAGLDYQRQYLFVDDAVKALLILGDMMQSDGFDKGRAWNFGPEASQTVEEIIEAVSACFESTFLYPMPGIVIDGSAMGETRVLGIDSTRAMRDLAWRPETSLADGISRTAAWMTAYFERVWQKWPR
jgi:CDP-glucose 4,6-dehydratase